MKDYFKTLCVLISLILSYTYASSQEVLTGLSINKQIYQKSQSQSKKTTKAGSLQLPFVDDFSNYVGYPDSLRWEDRQGFVNRTFALQPPTIGVVTLDALNENGEVYPHADRVGFEADALTSLPIRLDMNFNLNRPMRLADSLYFSFYYQPAGGSLSGLEWERRGNQPEQHDSLVLEFGYGTGNIIFTGFDYCDYILAEDETFAIGDSLANPYIPGQFYVFENAAFPGDIIVLPCDSLFGEEHIWKCMWSTPGESLDNWLANNELDYFKLVMIPIDTIEWLRNNFQFRFRNLASLEDNDIVGWASNVDQWHIDYVKLDVNRSAQDIYPNDLAFVEPTTTMLQKYYAMPWSQYRSSDLRPSFQNYLSNLSNNIKNSYYTYNVVKAGGALVTEYTPNNENISPYHSSGLQSVAAHVNPGLSITLPQDAADSVSFIITHIFQEVGTGDERRCNDTCVFEQNFYNYYAYDDGTAEAGYSLLSTLSNPEAYFAMRFTLAQPDTLRSVRMWFNSVLEDANVEEFDIMVWNDNNGFPGEIIYYQTNQLPAHADIFTDFVDYYLAEPQFVSGTFYVGFYQNNDVQLNLGFDQNTDGRDNFVYNVSGTWHEPFLKGTPMIRPVIGKAFEVSGVCDSDMPVVNIYPNPATTSVTIVSDNLNQLRSYRLYNAFGQLIKAEELSQSTTNIAVSDLKSGLYLLQIVDFKGQVLTKKFIKQ
ncbi:MAG: T9SS type A sorting domain-containing protein [Bacteroidales bacterium]|nr:T9SS type A sorting domain-containing protein [Bacteroidales bacterium]